ncbi:MAG: AAA family ATPase [Lactobacillales bacterium]|jgi:predicted ATPase|nr:AAA family ATPase [Lactobacillales bacterium]
MQESIIIKNFGPVKHIEIEDIRPFTVFIGESGSGKSTIMKVIILFRWIYKWVNIRSYLKHSNISQSLVEFEFNELLKKNGLIEYLKDNTEIIYKRGSSTVHYKNKLSTSDLVPKGELSLEKMCFVADRRNIISDILANRVNVQSDFYLKETLDDTLLSLKKISQLDIDYLGVKFKTQKTNGIPKYEIENIDQNEHYSINLYNASSGTQTIVPLSVIVEYFSKHYDFKSRFNDIVVDYLKQSDNLKDFRPNLNIGEIKNRSIHIHIEEPELSLYPESQRSLINFIVNRCFVENHKDYNMTVMMATHSPYIINHLNLLIKAYDKNKLVEGAKLNYNDVSVYQVDEGEIFDLKAQNIKLINTNPLSETINNIYDEYDKI